ENLHWRRLFPTPRPAKQREIRQENFLKVVYFPRCSSWCPGGNGEGMTDPREEIEEDQQRLDELGREIEDVRHQTPEWKEQHERHFMDEGAESEDVDNTIVPPG